MRIFDKTEWLRFFLLILADMRSCFFILLLHYSIVIYIYYEYQIVLVCISQLSKEV